MTRLAPLAPTIPFRQWKKNFLRVWKAKTNADAPPEAWLIEWWRAGLSHKEAANKKVGNDD